VLQGVVGCCRVSRTAFENIYQLCTAGDRRKDGRLTVCCRVLQCVATCCSVLQGVAGCCRVAGSCTVSCIVFENIYKLCTAEDRRKEGRLTVCYSVLQCVEVCCNVLQCVAVCCRVLQGVEECHAS